MPSIMIAMASINCNLYREFKAVRDYDSGRDASFFTFAEPPRFTLPDSASIMVAEA